MIDPDKALLTEIQEAADRADDAALARAVFAYYHDRTRADRTPRAVLYFHLGLLVGALGAPTRKAPRQPRDE